MVNPVRKILQWILNQTNNCKFVKTLDFDDLEILEKAKDSIKNFNEKSREEALWCTFYPL